MNNAQPNGSTKLKKDLGLYDVFCVSTGAMFSSGFFLLPGLAAAKAGPSVLLAYLLAGILIMPAMFSACELSTALPRAGGAYYFLDRSLGPLVGTIGGLGTYLALTLKTAFALIGIGAYLVFFIDLPIKPVAIGLTLLFMLVNIVGAKETSSLQRILVTILVVILGYFIVQGGYEILFNTSSETLDDRFSDFMPNGIGGLLSTVGFVFVSYAGLTKVASVAEEVRNPERNIPLGMMLSLGVTSLIYVAGVAIMVALVEPGVLTSDMTPVATASEAFTWLPGRWVLLLIVVAALAAFASTGNAGMMSASRYPLAMARDRLLPACFGSVGRFGTPTLSVLVTGGVMILVILFMNAEGIAKLASAFQLFIFILLNFAVIVMRESRLDSYDPGFRSPLYPWMQLFGMLSGAMLIIYMGWMAVFFTGAVVAICIAWYRVYARGRVERHGAIFHWFQQLGRRQYSALDQEFRGIMKEKGIRDDDPFDEVVARAGVVDLSKPAQFSEVLAQAAEAFSSSMPMTKEEILERFEMEASLGSTPVMQGVALPHFRSDKIARPCLVLLRSTHPIQVPGGTPDASGDVSGSSARIMFLLISPNDDPGLHLRILAQIASRVEEPSFEQEWQKADRPQALREVLMRDEAFLTIRLSDGSKALQALGDRCIRDLDFPDTCLVALIRRPGGVVIPNGNTRLQAGDALTVLGNPKSLKELGESYN